ncbi:uncharacterized protein LOC132719326 [Ruditapes philippinarum]|uniref:uncharacterized protein LOC132719326 n=1 Tax=Ruditapes philippinarum TaxID=129788 RepID=UPI00295ADCC4|nr:uncharacterized protein LOC132719326 [Ruditapes philippinarum]
MDTLAHTDQSDASLYLRSEETHFQITPVRPELPLPIDQQVRAELSQQCPTNHLDALVNSEQAGRIKSWNEKRKDICKCRLPNQCKCSKIHISRRYSYRQI